MNEKTLYYIGLGLLYYTVLYHRCLTCEVAFTCFQQHAFRIIQLGHFSLGYYCAHFHRGDQMIRQRKNNNIVQLNLKKKTSGKPIPFLLSVDLPQSLGVKSCVRQWLSSSSGEQALATAGRHVFLRPGLLYWLTFLPTSALRSRGYCRSLNWSAGRCSQTPWWSLRSVQTRDPLQHLERRTVHVSIGCPQGRICSYQSSPDLVQECVLKFSWFAGLEAPVRALDIVDVLQEQEQVKIDRHIWFT